MALALFAAVCSRLELQRAALVMAGASSLAVLISSVYCGGWLARRLARDAVWLFLLRLFLPLMLLAVNGMLLATVVSSLSW